MAQIQLGPKLAIAVARGGGLGGIPCAMLSAQQIERSVSEFRAALGQNAPLNLNFFAHKTPVVPSPEESPNEAARQTMERLERWRQKLTPYYRELGVPLPELPIKIANGATVLCSATTVEEAQWLEQHGVDAIIAQGAEAGGHRGTFLAEDLREAAHSQVGTLTLVAEIVRSVRLPVIAAGGIVDGRGIAAALALGAQGVQIGTAFMFSTEFECPHAHKMQLLNEQNQGAHCTAITNLFTGRPARSLWARLMHELGPIGDPEWV